VAVKHDDDDNDDDDDDDDADDGVWGRIVVKRLYYC